MQELLEIILEVKIKRLVYLNNQETIEITSDGRGIRLDVYVEDNDNTVYDIEMQTRIVPDLPKRSRYYQGMIDLNLIERGARYSELKKSIVIFICLNDPFGKGSCVYRFSNRSKEFPELQLKDETEKVFLNAAGERGEVSEKLRNFLHYLAKKEPCDEFTQKLQDEVVKARKREAWRLEYMTLHQRELEKFEEGLEEGLVRGLEQGREAGKMLQLIELVEMEILTKQQAADVVGMTLEEFEMKMKEK